MSAKMRQTTLHFGTFCVLYGMLYYLSIFFPKYLTIVWHKDGFSLLAHGAHGLLPGFTRSIPGAPAQPGPFFGHLLFKIHNRWRRININCLGDFLLSRRFILKAKRRIIFIALPFRGRILVTVLRTLMRQEIRRRRRNIGKT